MGSSFTTTSEGVVYQERRTALLRAFIAAVGLTAVLASLVFVALMRRAGWPATGAQWGGMAASLLGIVAFCGFGAYCLRMAWHLTRQKMMFDGRQQLLLVDTQSMAAGRRQLILPFSDITGLAILEHRPEDGAPTFAIAASLHDGSTLAMGAFNQRSKAQQQLDALAVLTGLQG
ncbi:MAG: hypothetical protein EOO54_22070 [Haliea sp.]|nr:MAG: hypothetical protein EOO54_22070 [Haliea sp.]